uniref:Reverse transcriptase domain-containing protein n=1 Tax=Clytia hemisphaerica TaxID=252671 RepID=A0A7M5XGL9_9CNID
NRISDELYKKLRPTGSQPARLYGLTKIHKPNIPIRPVVSMSGSAYHKIAKKVSKWLSVVEECNINTSTKSIVEKIADIELPEGHELVSFDVCSLYTNVPVQEAIT